MTSQIVAAQPLLSLYAAEARPDLAYVELSLDDKRTLIGVNDTVTYFHGESGSLEGRVVALCEDADAAVIRVDSGFGWHEVRMPLGLLELCLKAGVGDVGSEGE